jgi:hypothetical protein
VIGSGAVRRFVVRSTVVVIRLPTADLPRHRTTLANIKNPPDVVELAVRVAEVWRTLGTVLQ